MNPQFTMKPTVFPPTTGEQIEVLKQAHELLWAGTFDAFIAGRQVPAEIETARRILRKAAFALARAEEVRS